MPTQKNFRLNHELRARFEKLCRENLLDERSVVEAWLLQFLEGTTEQRQVVAKRYSDWIAERAQSPAKEMTARRGKKKS